MSDNEDLKQKRAIIVDNFRKKVIKRRIIRVKYINKNVYLSEGKYSSGYMLSM